LCARGTTYSQYSDFFIPWNGTEGLAVESEMTSLHHNVRDWNSPGKDRIVTQKARGFSLLEMLVVVAIVLIVACITFISLQPMLRQTHVNQAYDTTLMTLRRYRSQSITQRRRYQVQFAAPRTITVWFLGVGVPVNPAPVLVQTLTLPPDIQFAVQAGIPNTAATVPDGFGNGGTAIDFDQGAGLGSQNYVLFMPDGSSQDNLGNLNSGIVYLGRPGDIWSMRAVTVFGSTGRIRGWRLNQVPAGGNVWTQQ
jgi:prepilin-type N-terminal cleavage/methylation domain-containing protein